jgi:hypothetical protein
MPRKGSVPVEPECLSRAVDRLTAAGYTHGLRAEKQGLRDLATEQLIAPEDLVVDETVRIEGISDPADESMVLALRDRSGQLRGTYVVAFGSEASTADAAMLPRLRAPGTLARGPSRPR